MTPKTGKHVTQVTSYRLISFKLILSKQFEKLHFKTPLNRININNRIPDHQYGLKDNIVLQNKIREQDVLLSTIYGYNTCFRQSLARRTNI